MIAALVYWQMSLLLTCALDADPGICPRYPAPKGDRWRYYHHTNSFRPPKVRFVKFPTQIVCRSCCRSMAVNNVLLCVVTAANRTLCFMISTTFVLGWGRPLHATTCATSTCKSRIVHSFRLCGFVECHSGCVVCFRVLVSIPVQAVTLMFMLIASATNEFAARHHHRHFHHH